MGKKKKLTNTAQLSFAERALLQEHNRFWAKINNEAKVRRVMSYDDLEKARAGRAAKEATKEAAKEAKKVASSKPEAEEATAGKEKRGRKRKRGALGADAL
ncbi:hypothetical protein B7463_g9185, partial [Scytalidium lignicola]